MFVPYSHIRVKFVRHQRDTVVGKVTEEWEVMDWK